MSRDTEFGKASVVAVCGVFGLSRAAYYAAKRETSTPARTEAEESPLSSPSASGKARRGISVGVLRDAILAIATQHPAWGVRKVHAMLRRCPHELCTSRKRVWALMKDMGLTFSPGCRPGEAPRGTVAVEYPNRLWGTDMTTAWTKEDGLVAIVPVIDCGCRSLLELRVTKSQESPAILSAVGAALFKTFGAPTHVPDGLELRTDHGPQYTGGDCEELCKRWRLDHTFAPVGRPTGNAVTERLIRTMKEECLWLRDWNSIAELQAALDAWRIEYNVVPQYFTFLCA